MRLTDGEITLRNAEEQDAEQLAAWWNDGRVMAHAGFPLGLGTTPEKIAASLRTDSDDARRRLILEWNGAPIGEMSYRILENGNAEIGVKICEASYQEKGIGRRALSLLIQALFEKGCPKIVLDTNANNARAQHVYELLGFRKTALHPDAWQDQLGRPQTTVDYELTGDRFVSWLPSSP